LWIHYRRLSIDELIEGQRRNELIASATGETLTSRLGVRREKGGRDANRVLFR
jgi:hypothetical protein